MEEEDDDYNPGAYAVDEMQVQRFLRDSEPEEVEEGKIRAAEDF